MLGMGIAPAADVLYKVVHRVMSPDDRRVLDEPGVADMFIDDILRGIRRGGLGAVLQDVVLFDRDWVPGARRDPRRALVARGRRRDRPVLPRRAHVPPPAGLRVHPVRGGAHLCGYMVSDDVLDAVTAER